MNEQFIDRLEQPRSLALEELFEAAVDNVTEQLREYGAKNVDEWALGKIAYTYYYDWEHDDPDVVFLLEDPGHLNQRHTRRVRRLEALQETYTPRAVLSCEASAAFSELLNATNS